MKQVLSTYTWSNHNIGDMTICPGLARLLERHCPDTKFIPISYPACANSSNLERTQKIFDDKYPDIKVIPCLEEGILPLDGDEEKALILDILSGSVKFLDTLFAKRLAQYKIDLFRTSDLVIYNSGMILNCGWEGAPGDPMTVLRTSLPLIIARELGIPYGIYSHSFESFDDGINGRFLVKLLSEAQFIFCRDPDSLAYIKSYGVEAPLMELGPDSTVFFDWCDDDWADDFMQEHDLKSDQFGVFVPIARLLQNKVHHHMTQAAAIIEHWVNMTQLPVVLAPEVDREIPTIIDELYPKLSPEVQERCILQTSFWTSAQAKALYRRARLLMSMEHHSTLMSIPSGVPTLHTYVREQGRKYSMFKAIGLGENLFDIWQTPIGDIVQRMNEMNSDWAAERERTSAAAQKLEMLGEKSVKPIKSILANN